MTGKIKFFDWKKGFGFIAGDDGKDYFVGYGGMIKMSKKGPIAINVTRPE